MSYFLSISVPASLNLNFLNPMKIHKYHIDILFHSLSNI